ncbi:hypothetical protein FJT64_020528 [Amphibalanus amphitrite]|uniref:Uncharacterized protein n=1 Tax=Amphibalanus amphitrite TaxID=1232801 RepID=A0A6A4WWK3_AMPAM|nr:uncharacterized protein LOC122375154 [Amphibalanus amphitrite]KAF0308244.1 hypothetical protein FJT64_020528 [Amphibalanus amphitrite]
MQALQFALLLIAAASVVSGAPTSYNDDYNYDYDYGSYETGGSEFHLPSSMFDNLRPQPVKRDSPVQSPCSWAVVQCCGVPDQMGSRASCFSRLGCPGAWFSDICTPTIQKSVLRSIIDSQTGRL